MSTSTNASATTAVAQPCSCDEARAQFCCSLDSLTQPRFFCGQLLTAQDLSALLCYAQDKMRLGRYRHGWGVVCGLDVQADPSNPLGILVRSGYAADCCGDDIVVVDDARLDLTEACDAVDGSCGKLTRPVDAGKQVVVDIVIRYTEQPSAPLPALVRGACGNTSRCEFSRTREAFALDWSPVAADQVSSDPMQKRADDWHVEYNKVGRAVLDAFRAWKPSGMTAKQFKDWVRQRMMDHPLQHFPYVRDDIENSVLDPAQPATQALVLFWLIQDRRIAFLIAGCPVCAHQAGVPLARVYLDAADAATGENYHVTLVDAYPPYRRAFDAVCWPAPSGRVNLGQFVWQREADVRVSLAQLGLDVAAVASPLQLTSPDTLDTVLDCLPESRGLFVPCPSSVTLQTYPDRIGVQRVVGFAVAEVS